MKISDNTKETILALQKKYPEKRSALIPALHIVQNETGYLPLEIQAEVADLFDLDPAEVKGVVSFYDMFFEKPVGKHIIHVCKNVCCMLRGGDDLLQRLCRKLGIKPGDTTADGKYTVIASECLAACDKAPMLIAGERVIGPVQEGDLDQILQELQHE